MLFIREQVEHLVFPPLVTTLPVLSVVSALLDSVLTTLEPMLKCLSTIPLELPAGKNRTDVLENGFYSSLVLIKFALVRLCIEMPPASFPANIRAGVHSD